jgi:hypothetical protein
MKETTVTMALQTFQQFGMVEIVDGVITIPNWGKHQSLDAYEKKKERDRIYQAERRAAQRAIAEKSSDTSSDIASLEEDIDKEREEELDNKKENISCQQIVDLYHSICTSFPSVRSLSDARKKAIKARLKTYTLEDFKSVFEKAEASSFLKGLDGGWKASFDWLIKEANMLKVLEGNYEDKQQRFTRNERKPNWMQPSMEMGEAELNAIKRLMGTETVEDNPAVAEEAEAMQQRLREKYGRKEA